jgi:predicted ATPase/DNA-binding winged helix-turn-helix (wHTH) protein
VLACKRRLLSESVSRNVSVKPEAPLDCEYLVGPVQVCPAERRVWLGGQSVPLGARAFDMLLALITHRGQVVSKEVLLSLVWPALIVEEGNLAVQVSALRKLLGAGAITTVPGRGYQLTAAVSERRRSQQTAGKAEPASEQPAAEVPAFEQAQKVRGWVPSALTPILGRDAALAELQQLLQATRCLTLTGAGGSGKTRLAQALASSVRARYEGGVWWIGLDRLADTRLLATTLAQALGSADPHKPPVQRLVEQLKGRAALLVLDNCEHLVDDCAELAAQLLRELALLQVLTTSRESLRVPGEVVWTVPPLEVPAAVQPPCWSTLLRHASVQLLVQRINQHHSAFVVTQDNAAALVQICRGLDGLPLALELVAAQVGPQTLAEVAARLDRSLSLMNVGARGGTPHHQTMAAAVEWGYKLLGATEAALFLRLSVFVGGWTQESAAAVCFGLGVEADDLPALLSRLQRVSMVLCQECSGTVRFRMLEPIRQFAIARLQAQGELMHAKSHWLAWTVGRCKAMALQLGGPQQIEGYRFLDSELDNLRALLHWAQQADLESGLRLASSLWRFWQTKGHAKEMLAWFEETLPRATDVPRQVVADASNSAGVMARTCGLYDAAVRLHSASLALQRELGNRRGEAVALNNLCVVARDQYDHVRVEQHGLASLANARDIGDRNLEGLALMHLGTAQSGQDRIAQARSRFQQSLAIFDELGDQTTSAALLNYLGGLDLAEGHWPEAAHRFQQALALNEALSNFWGLAITHYNLASLQHEQAEDDAALQLLSNSPTSAVADSGADQTSTRGRSSSKATRHFWPSQSSVAVC